MKSDDEIEAEELLPCPACGRSVAASAETMSIIHALPVCLKFAKMSATDYWSYYYNHYHHARNN